MSIGQEDATRGGWPRTCLPARQNLEQPDRVKTDCSVISLV
jgi:hypothetical protein